MNVSKGGFLFDAAAQVPNLTDNFKAQDLRRYTPWSGHGKPAYFAAIQAALARDYRPLERCFSRVLSRTSSRAGAPGA